MNPQDSFGSTRSLTASLAAVIVAVSCCSSMHGEERNGMLLIPARKAVVGTSAAQREELAKRFDCHPTWLGDDLTRYEVQLPAFWIDRKSQPARTMPREAGREQLATVPTRGPITFSAAGGTSRHLSIRIPTYGPEALSLSEPETIIWNGNGVMTWRKTPDMTWTAQTPQRAAYEMRFEQRRVEAGNLLTERT